MAPTDRTGYIKGLRALADILDNNPALPLPWDGGHASRLSIFVETREQAAGYARLIPGKVIKKVTDSSAYGFELRGSIAGLRVLVYAPRPEVCERVVTGSHEVTTPAMPCLLYTSPSPRDS